MNKHRSLPSVAFHEYGLDPFQAGGNKRILRMFHLVLDRWAIRPGATMADTEVMSLVFGSFYWAF